MNSSLIYFMIEDRDALFLFSSSRFLCFSPRTIIYMEQKINYLTSIKKEKYQPVLSSNSTDINFGGR